MEPISSLNPVLDALRRQLAENIERLRKSGKLAAGSRAARAGQGAARAEGLETILRRRIAPLDRKSPEGRSQATRVFVESVLAAEFGDALLADPGLGELLGEISASLREDAEIRGQLDSLLAEL